MMVWISTPKSILDGIPLRYPLHYATSAGHRECISFLLDHGADPEITDFLNLSSLSWAEERGYDDIVAMFQSYSHMKEPGV
jgi:ankyrin repeat protein